MPSPYLLSTHCNIVPASTSRSFKCSVSFRLSHQNPVCTSSRSMRATRPANLILDLVNRILYGEEYGLRIFSFCSLLHSCARPKYHPQHPILNIVRLFPSFDFRDQVSHPCKTSTNLCVMLCYIITTIFERRQTDNMPRSVTELSHSCRCAIRLPRTSRTRLARQAAALHGVAVPRRVT